MGGMKRLNRREARKFGEYMSLTAFSTVALCPPDGPPHSTATQRPVPTPSGSLDCKPCGAPPRLGAVEGGQGGLLGDSRGGIVRSYSLAEKSLEQVQTRYGKEG